MFWGKTKQMMAGKNKQKYDIEHNDELKFTYPRPFP